MLAPLVLWLAPELGPVLGAIVVAVLGLILLLSIWLLLKPIGIAVGYIPVVGHAAAEGVFAAAGQITSWVNSWIDGIVWPIIRLIMAPVQAVVGFASVTVGSIEYLMGELRLVAQMAAGELGYVARQIASLVNTANGLALRLASAAAVAAGALSLARYLEGTAIPAARSQAIAAAEGYAASRVDTETRAREGAVAGAETLARGLVGTEARLREGGDATLRSTITTAADTLERELTGLRGQVRDIESTQVVPLEREVTDLRDVAIPAAIAGAAAATKAVADELTQTKTQCVDPLCNGLLNTANLFGALAAGAELALLLELVASAIADPQGTAGEVGGLVGGVHSAASSLLSPAVGATL